MTQPSKQARSDNIKKNKQSTWFTAGQVSTPFLSFMNNFNPPRANKLHIQHYKKIKDPASIYTKMDFTSNEQIQEKIIQAIDRLTKYCLDHDLDNRPKIPKNKRRIP